MSKIYNSYTLEQLSQKSTYEQDNNLATLGRCLAERLANLHRNKPISTWKQEFLEGKHADVVYAELESFRVENQKNIKLLNDLEKIKLPSHVVTTAGSEILISGPFCEALHGKLKRLGYWDGANYTNRKLWIIDVDKVASLNRVLKNYLKITGRINSNVIKKASAQKLGEMERWLGYVEQKSIEGYVYTKGVDTLIELGIRDYPDLQLKLDAAIQCAEKKKEEQQALRAKEKNINDQERLKAKSSRILFSVENSPLLNDVFKWREKFLLIESYGKTFYINEDAPSCHGSHLLGYEGTLGHYGYFREATTDEIAELEKENATIEAEKNNKKLITGLMKHIQENGNQLEETIPFPDGEVLFDTFSIYGGGSCLVVQQDKIWYVKNNGMDGDCWSLNNVTTGGAGAIGWFISKAEDLMTQINNLKANDVTQ